MRKLIITAGLGLMLILPATASAAKPKTAKTTHARSGSVKHAKLKTAPKKTKRAQINDRMLLQPKWS
jgi:hypothetical protein